MIIPQALSRFLSRLFDGAAKCGAAEQTDSLLSSDRDSSSYSLEPNQ